MVLKKIIVKNNYIHRKSSVFHRISGRARKWPSLKGRKKLTIDGFIMYATVIDIFSNLLHWNANSFDAINAVTDGGFPCQKNSSFTQPISPSQM